MRIILLSDTHGDFFTAHEIVKRHLRDADCFIHLGDGFREWEDLRDLYPDKQMLYSRGNCDLGSDKKSAGTLSCENGHRIFYTHGHLYRVKYGFDDLMKAARDAGCDIVVFGHTHQACRYYEDGLYLMNPGSPCCPRDSKPGYGMIDITDAGVVCNNVVWKPGGMR